MEDRTERAIQAGKQAKQLLDTPVLVMAFEQIEREAFDHWIASPGGAVEARERLHAGVLAVRKLRQKLEALVTNGLMSEASLEAQRMEQEFAALNRTPGEMSE